MALRAPKGRAELPEGARFRVEILDTWEMTVAPVRGTFAIHPQGSYLYVSDAPPLKLPGRPHLVLRIQRTPGPE